MTRRATLSRLASVPASVLLALGAGGCVSGEGFGATDEGFSGAVADLQAEFGGGDGKADLFGVDECDVLAPILEGTDATIRSGFFYGIEGAAVLGGVEAYGGFDVVFDLYHHQMAVAQYYGGGVALAAASVSAQVYAGFATGFDHGVSDWGGYFVTTNVEVGLPFLQEFLSLNASVFVSGVDDDGNLLISPDEIVLPPDGVFGFGVGVEVGAGLPTGLPVEGSLQEGLWQPFDEAIRYYYDGLRDTRFARIGEDLDVHLVDHHTGEECSPDWPHGETREACVIEFGQPDWSNTRRSLHMAYAICTVTGGCEVPIAWPMSAGAIGVGAVRDVGGDLAGLCPELGFHATQDSGH